MAIIEKTGTYVDANGDSWFYRAGDAAPEGLRPSEIPAEMKRHGAPENRAGAPAETRAKGPEKAPEARGKGAR